MFIPCHFVTREGETSLHILDNPRPVALRRFDGVLQRFRLRPLGDLFVYVEDGSDWTAEGLRFLIGRARS